MVKLRIVFAALAIVAGAALVGSAVAETDRGTKSVTIKTIERSWRINIESPVGASPVLTAHREIVQKAGGEVVGRETGIQVTRTLSAVKGDTVQVNGKTFNAGDVADAIAAIIDKWREEDIAAAAAAAAAAKQ